MINFLSPHLKEKIRPIALPAWLRLQEVGTWQRAVQHATKRRTSRPFFAFGVGLPKTGTLSLANLLKKNYRAAHEPETWILTHLFESSTIGCGSALSADDRGAILQTRDRLLRLSFESNFVLAYIIDDLYETFPNAKFILTVRHPISWVNSEINQQYVIGYRQPWSRLADYRYGAWRFYNKHEKKLKDLGLYPTEGYFTYWSRHIHSVRQAIPEEQLLVVRTEDLSYRTEELADFLSIPHDSLNVERSHSHKRTEKPLHIQDLVDRDFLVEQANQYCSPLLDEFYDSTSLS